MIRRGGVPAALKALGLALLLSAGACATAPSPPVAGAAIVALDDPALKGTRWGLSVMTLDGEVVAQVRADDRFIPASNTKIFTTAAAFARLDGLDAPDPEDGTSVRRVERTDGGAPDIVLVGAGDPSLSDGPACAASCLAELADAVKATGLTRIGDAIGDDRLYPDERWGPGWSWDDMQTSFGAAASALTVNDNVVVLEVSPGEAGAPVTAVWRAGDDVLVLDNQAVTVADGEGDLRLERRPGETSVRLYGRLPVSAQPVGFRIAVDDPALAAAERFRRLLEQRGIVVEGAARSRHRPLTLADDPAARTGPASPVVAEEGTEIAHMSRRPLIASLQRISKSSQNLHAELMLRRLGAIEGTGSRADGLAQVETVMAAAGIDRAAYDLHDGSGMSVYNRVSPDATTRFLVWAAAQPWFEAWRATLPVGGRDGSLARRFVGTPLEGRIFAKTGTLSSVNALAGFMTTASGRTLAFSIYANDRPSVAGSATPAMDQALLDLAAAN